ATISVHKSSIRFTINKKKVSLDVDMFREILQICLKITRQEFDDLPLEQDILSFIRDIGNTRDFTYLIDVNVTTYINHGEHFLSETPKPKYVRKKADYDTSPKQKPVQATKDKGTGTIPGVPNIPIYDSESDKESWGDSDEEDDDKDEFEDDADINDDDR
nr:hypothetical protein [Tanacetum cinerariifolium]